MTIVTCTSQVILWLMRKDSLRMQMRQLKRQFTRLQLDELSLPVIRRLKERLCDAQVILAYYSLPDEVNTHQLIDDLVAEGKSVFLPKVMGDETMAWFPYHGPQDLKEGAFHIMEPTGENHGDRPLDSYLMNHRSVILVPGMAFDAQGHRLGRGKGYYDRFLSTVETVLHVQTIGVCFDFQKVPEVPVDTFDRSVDEVI